MSFLSPLGWVYGTAAAARRSLYRRGVFSRRRLSGPVISIGNLTVGGSGKTPLAAWVVRELMSAGHAVAVLSRGYGGAFRGDALVVSDGARVLAEPAQAGDEPVMLARQLRGAIVAIGPRRDVVGAEVARRFGHRVFVLDDGFQHLRLERDLDILCVDHETLRGEPLPAGRLREFPKAAALADVVVVAGAFAALAPSQLVVSARRKTVGFFDLAGRPTPAPSRAYLVSGIARADRFEADVLARGAQILSHERFADHQAFTEPLFATVLRSAARERADAIVTTEKNAVWLDPSDREVPIRVLRSEIVVDEPGPFRERLLRAASVSSEPS